ncbi:MAG TPA: hypothetical protein VKA27_14750 [Sunxiuqinia sp.]|nr:hypothetical protein [Sunxiuqinia sp.]
MKKLIRNSILFSLPFLVAIIALFFIPVDKKFSYHFVRGECSNKASWMYHRVFEDPRPIDIVFSGASQTSCAIMDKVISEKLSQEDGKPVNVVNYGYCRRGRDMQYVMLKDLFAHKHPRLLVIEVPEDEPKKSHPVFPYLAESSDLFGSFVLINQRYFSAIWKGVVVRFEYVKSMLTGNKFVETENNFSEYGYWHSSHVVSDATVLANRKAWERRLAKQKPEIIRHIELNYSKHYLKKIVNMAHQNNCKVLFLYLPEIGSGVQSPFLYDYYKQFCNVIFLPKEITSDQSNWKDATHFNDTGAMEVSTFLLPYLSADK